MCFKTDWIVLQTKCGNLCSKYIQIKCKLAELCDECVLERRQKIYAKIYYKFENSDVRKLILWTLGTNWRGNDGYTRLNVAWTKFRKRMYHERGFQPVFRVTETGSKGGFLHIHFLNTGFLKHSRVLFHWRKTTSLLGANVNYSSRKSDPIKAINYLMKYMTKHPKKPSLNYEKVDILAKTVKYSWLGEWYKIKFEKLDKFQCKHDYDWSFYNLIERWDGKRSKKMNSYFINQSLN